LILPCPYSKRGGEISKELRINEEITAPEVRVIDGSGKQLGVFATKEALRMAIQQEIDLVEVAPEATPPVCRLMDYGKYIYSRTKREREARKSQKAAEIKEIRLRPKTGEHDIQFKMKQIRTFLGDGAKVRVRIWFKGREISHSEIGRELLNRVMAELSDAALVEQLPMMEGQTMFMLLSPKKVI
jgi:translation initiation factor IF-3